MTADYVLVGHITADLTPNGRVAGGTVSYAARTASAFGWRVAIVTSTKADEPLLETLTPYADIHVVPADDTTTFENIYGPAGRTQYIRARANTLRAEDIPTELRGAPMVHLGPIADEDSAEIASVFPNATVLATLQGWMRQWTNEGVVSYKPLRDEAVLKHIDIAVFSEEDIGRAREEEAWISKRVRHTFVTRAERGGSYYHDGVEDSYTTPEVTVIEPTGAGDVFAASLLSSLPLVSFDMRKATQIAAVLAANSVTRPSLLGTPSREEVQLALTGELKVQDGQRD